MSGIYIPNMKMPKNCFACNFAVDGVCVAMKPPKTRHWRAEDVTNHCPLVTVSDHGRLIDADAIEYTHEVARSLDDRHNWLEAVVTQDEIADLPTIIPADKESE